MPVAVAKLAMPLPTSSQNPAFDVKASIIEIPNNLFVVARGKRKLINVPHESVEDRDENWGKGAKKERRQAHQLGGVFIF